MNGSVKVEPGTFLPSGPLIEGRALGQIAGGMNSKNAVASNGRCREMSGQAHNIS